MNQKSIINQPELRQQYFMAIKRPLGKTSVKSSLLKDYYFKNVITLRISDSMKKNIDALVKKKLDNSGKRSYQNRSHYIKCCILRDLNKEFGFSPPPQSI